MKMGGDSHATQGAICALLVPCSSRKKVRPSLSGQAVSLPISDQSRLETAWIERLNSLPIACRAGDLYGGRGFQLALRASQISEAPLYAISAGLGLVAIERSIPAYGLTVSGKGPESIVARINDHFDPTSWWSAVSRGPYSTPMTHVFSNDVSKCIVVALSQSYARMLASSLDALPNSAIARLRIVGANLGSILPSRLSSSLLPYDERLQAVLPGTRNDFAQRALLHFVSSGLTTHPDGDAATHRAWVLSALSGKKAPVQRQRERLRDEDIRALIQRHLPRTTGIGRLLRVLRDREGVACEQARFSRLYREAANGRGLV
jgi:hypothetical protein